ncbi:anthranilate synthase component I family protein [Stratiformator vulcanicus]
MSAEARAEWIRRRVSAESNFAALPAASASQIEPDPSVLHPHAEIANVFSDHPAAEYREAVGRVIEYIRAGDIFQANLSQRLLTPFRGDPLNFYSRLRTGNAAPYAGLAHFDDWWLLSASPESFVQLDGRDVVTRPIKGTRRRQLTPEADLGVRIDLECSEKDRAENVMIVDLLRNDLSRVCTDESVRVPKLCRLESFATVHHLVSEVTGTLNKDRTLWDLLAATLPGGSISGAPKVRAMEIIGELEPTVRGPYCGNLFYQGFGGQAAANILIRTILCRGGWAQLPVGGGITMLSDPQAEYQETIDKAVGMLAALELV